MLPFFALIAVCQNVTCKNGGTCQVDDRGFKCSCTGDFQGTYCENLRGTAKFQDITETPF